MKKIIFLMLSLITMTYFSCEKCEPIVFEPCGETNPEYGGWTVATYYGSNEGGRVGTIYNTSMNSQAPKGDDWATTTTHTQVVSFDPANWTSDKIGQVFGIAIDDAENIYLGSSDIYFPFIAPSGNIGRPYPPGQIFKCVPPTWQAVPLAVLPNSGGPVNGTGNLAFDKWNKQLFVTNLEDGKIYKLATDGTILETYDPWVPDNLINGIVAQDESVWGIGVNEESGKVKVYFPRVSASERSIYSITLIAGNFPPAGSEVLEISNLPGSQKIVSDLAFSTDGQELLIAERGDPHQALAFSYSMPSTTWTLNQIYFVGSSVGQNSAGGLDFAYTEADGHKSESCDEFFWVSGNYMDARNSTSGKIYGMEGISYSGNNASSASIDPNMDTDLFIDYGAPFKSSLGDVEVFDCTVCGDPCGLDDVIN